MPLLSQRDFDNLKATPAIPCTCGNHIKKNYCRQCDEFYYLGHEAGCRFALDDVKHETHRTYDLSKSDEYEARVG